MATYSVPYFMGDHLVGLDVPQPHTAIEPIIAEGSQQFRMSELYKHLASTVAGDDNPVVWAGDFQSRWLQRLANMWGVIWIGTGPKSIVRALSTASEALNNGELVCIFPEGGITRSGALQTFKPGLMRCIDTLRPVAMKSAVKMIGLANRIRGKG